MAKFKVGDRVKFTDDFVAEFSDYAKTVGTVVDATPRKNGNVYRITVLFDGQKYTWTPNIDKIKHVSKLEKALL